MSMYNQIEKLASAIRNDIVAFHRIVHADGIVAIQRGPEGPVRLRLDRKRHPNRREPAAGIVRAVTYDNPIAVRNDDTAGIPDMAMVCETVQRRLQAPMKPVRIVADLYETAIR